MSLVGSYIDLLFVHQVVANRVVALFNNAALTLVVPVYAFQDADTVFTRLRRGHSWVYASIWVMPDYAAEPLPICP